MIEKTGLFPSQLLPEMLTPFLSDEAPALWLTCHNGGDAVGLLFAEPEMMAEGTWNIRALGVRPDLQGKGFGGCLVRACEDCLRQSGQRLLIVDTSGTSDFAGSRAFYTKLGYAEAARLRDFWAPGDDKVTFLKALI